MQTCVKCQQVKPFEGFYFRKDNQKYRGECKECTYAVTAAYRKTPEGRETKRRYERSSEAYKAQRKRYGAKYREENNGLLRVKAKLRYDARPDRELAKRAVQLAVRHGLIRRHLCWVCGKEDVQAHHASYAEDMRLDVVWLCRQHHMECHRTHL